MGDREGKGAMTSEAAKRSAYWAAQARGRVTENPRLEVMARQSFLLAYAVEEIWRVIEDPRHWEADAFHNQIIALQDAGGAGTYFEMLHSNHPIIPWPMPDQRFVGVIMDWLPPNRQSVAELNVDHSAGSKRTPDHQQVIELEPLEPALTRLTYSVATIRMEGISEVTRFFFRPWARFQLRRAIGKKLSHIRADLARAA